jgi:uncharacterized membrane protein YqgA involved in biofilm formation
MTGALLNTATVLAGGTAGLLLKSRLPQRVQVIVMRVLGVATIVLGTKMALGTHNVIVLVTSLAIGMTAGSLLQIQHRLECAAQRLHQRFAGAGASSTLADGFIDASLLFCVGPLTIVGSLQDGLTGDCKLIAVKSLLDGFAAMAFAAGLGWGVMLSALTVLIVQGGITLGAHTLSGFFTDPLVAECSAAGGALVVCIGVGLLGIKKLPVADYLPALVLAPLLVRFFQAF